jgi:hypothetical protein
MAMNLVWAGGVKQRHAGDLGRVLRGVGHGIGAAGRMPDEDERPVLAGAGKQGMQVPGGLSSVQRVGGFLAPALAGPVVGADTGGAGHGGDDARPRGGHPSGEYEHHRRPHPSHDGQPASPGAEASSTSPMAVITEAGTSAHRCGWLVSRVERTATMAPLAPNATRAEPVMADSVAPPSRPNVRAPAATAPAVSEVTTMRPRGPCEGAAAGPGKRPGMVTKCGRVG